MEPGTWPPYGVKLPQCTRSHRHPRQPNAVTRSIVVAPSGGSDSEASPEEGRGNLSVGSY
jgi:hypothetical protein